MFLAVPLTETIKIICANIEVLQPVSVLMSSGKALKHNRLKKDGTVVPVAPETDLPDEDRLEEAESIAEGNGKSKDISI